VSEQERRQFLQNAHKTLKNFREAKALRESGKSLQFTTKRKLKTSLARMMHESDPVQASKRGDWSY